MEQKPKSPWTPSAARLELDFQRGSLRDLRAHLRDFAKKEGIAYDVEETPDLVTVLPGNKEDGEALRKHAEALIADANRMLVNHKKGFSFELEQRGEYLMIQAKERKS